MSEATAKKVEAEVVEFSDVARDNVMDIMREVDNGAVFLDFVAMYREVLAAVKEHRKKGQVSFVLTIAPLEKFGPDAVAVEGDIKFQLPRKSYSSTIRFVDKHNMLVKDDPRQRDFKEVDGSFNCK